MTSATTGNLDPPPRPARWKKLVFFLAACVLVVGACETLLWGLGLMSPRVRAALSRDGLLVPPALPDDRLGWRPNPEHPEHDGRGYRNEKALSRCETLAFGDSQTYGVGVAPPAAWPRRLSGLTGVEVYSVAYGGWGPAQHLVLWDEVKPLQPKVVLQAFYAGNDLYDAFVAAYEHDVLPEHVTDVPGLRNRINTLRMRDPLKAKIERSFFSQSVAEWRNSGGRTRQFLSEYSKTYGLLRAAKREWLRSRSEGTGLSAPSANGRGDDGEWEQFKAFGLAVDPDAVFESERARTLFTCDYRLCGLNLTDARIREGLRISLEAIAGLHRRAAEDGAEHVVILIPTKELVFREEVCRHSADRVSERYRLLADNEIQMWSRTKEYLSAAGIRYVDTLPALEDCLRSGRQPYQVSRDGHPNEIGHEAIAKHLDQWLRSAGILDGLGKQKTDRPGPSS